jgi:hypothetical protein
MRVFAPLAQPHGGEPTDADAFAKYDLFAHHGQRLAIVGRDPFADLRLRRLFRKHVHALKNGAVFVQDTGRRLTKETKKKKKKKKKKSLWPTKEKK